MVGWARSLESGEPVGGGNLWEAEEGCQGSEKERLESEGTR